MSQFLKHLSPFANSRAKAVIPILRGMGLILICAWPLAVSPAQSPPAKPKFLATNLKSFGIPFRINANDESFIEVQLYVSSDQGRNWRFLERQSTDKTEFPFQAEGDGDYWFSIKTLNRNRQLIPEGKPTPSLIIQVDTVLPELEFDVIADAAGRIECRWMASDTNLKPESVKIAYQPIGADPENWTEIPVNLKGMVRNGSYADQLAWWPETSERSLNVRLSIGDKAGNTVYKERRINVAPAPWRHRNQSTALIGQSQSPTSPVNSTPQPLSPQSPAPQASPATEAAANAASAQSPASTDLTSHPNHSASDSDYHCENGVCVPRSANSPATSADQRLASGNQGGPLPPLGKPAAQTSPPANPVSAAQNSRGDLYGAAPDRVAAQSNPFPMQDPARSAVSWESERERWTRQSQTSSSTVRSPPVNSQNAPASTAPRFDNPQLPNPNPNQITRDSQHVVGQSSTQVPNQYRGLNHPEQPIASPEFLTGDEASNWGPAESENQTPGSGLEPQTANSTIGAGVPAPPSSLQNQAGALTQQLNSGIAQPDPSSFPQRGNEGGNPGFESNPMNSATQPMSSASYRPDDSQPGSVMEETPFDASVQMVASKRFRLNYAIDAIDPSGVARVDLWMTRDEGATWKSWGNDPDNQSPFPVEVEEEGRYGFRIVIHSRDGLTGRGPSRGDSPDIRVQVDTQSPLTQIVSVPYGRAAEAGRLVINYRVNDPHLTLRPISLFFSTNPQGPWTPIEEGLRNDGRYLWKPTANVPDRVFLRLDALDRAGNRGTHSLTQAIDISGLVPRGTIQGVVPVDQQ